MEPSDYLLGFRLKLQLLWGAPCVSGSDALSISAAICSYRVIVREVVFQPGRRDFRRAVCVPVLRLCDDRLPISAPTTAAPIAFSRP